MCTAPGDGDSNARLVATLGEASALALAQAFLQDAAALAQEVALRCDLPVLAFAEGDVAPLLPGWDIRPQSEGGLGRRMGAAFGAGATLLLGTDAPTLPPALAELAVAAVKGGADAAVVPTLDGGYCAIAMAMPLVPLLGAVPWGTPNALAMIRRCADSAGLRLVVQPSWHAVHVATDLELLRFTLDGGSPSGCSALPPWPASQTRAAVRLAIC